MSPRSSSDRRIDLREIIHEAVGNLHDQGRRSALALLGIMIGTASIIAMLNIGHVAQRETLKLFSNLGVDMLQLQASSVDIPPQGLDRLSLEKLPFRDSDVISVTPFATGRASVSYTVKQADLAVVGITPAFNRLMKVPLEKGRLIGTQDACATVAVAGAAVATQLSAPGSPLSPNSRIAVGDYIFTIIGILAPVTPQALSPADYNNSLFIPLACARRVLASQDPTAAMVRLVPGRDAEVVGGRLSAMLQKPGLSIQVISAQSMISVMNQQKQVHSRMLTAIGGISLLVGGIGVMNVMLMNVLERRREIGLRAAIGATPRVIQQMFLVEAGILACLGGVAGAIFGILASYVVAKGAGWTFELALYVLPLGPGMACIVGLIFGLYPAISASRLDPIEALRAE